MIEKRYFIDVQRTKLPAPVHNEIKELWIEYELSNDVCIIKTSINDLIDMMEDAKEYDTKCVNVNNLIEYLQDEGLKKDDLVILHYWW